MRATPASGPTTAPAITAPEFFLTDTGATVVDPDDVMTDVKVVNVGMFVWIFVD